MNHNVVQISPHVGDEVRARIIEAADALYEESEHQAIPTVHQVRQKARADMNSVSIVMREWRMALTVRAAPAPVQVPESVAAVNQQALAALWTTAQHLANESLQAAQARWEDEKTHFEAIRQQVATDYAELAQTHAEAQAAAQAHAEALQSTAAELTGLRSKVAMLQGKVEADAQHHAEQRKQAAAQTHKLVERLTQAQAERDEDRRIAAQARESTAKLQGHLETLQQQNAELMRLLAAGRVERNG